MLHGCGCLSCQGSACRRITSTLHDDCSDHEHQRMSLQCCSIGVQHPSFTRWLDLKGSMAVVLHHGAHLD
jgi:hypothetical protein